MPGLLALPGLGEPGRALRDDGRDVVPGLDVVDVRRLAPQALLGGEGRPRARAPGVALEGRDERRLLAAHEGAGALDELEVELEAAAEHVVAQDPVGAGLLDRPLQAQDGERVLGADVEDALRRAGHVAGDRHPLDERVRVALDLVAVHVGAGVALVRVADEVLLGPRGRAQELPLVPREVAGPAAAAQLGRLHLLDDARGVRVDQDLVEGLVAPDRDVLLDVVRVDEPAVAQDDLHLALEEGDLVPVGQLGVAVAVLHVPRQVVPLLDLAQHELGRRDLALPEAPQDRVHVVRLDAVEDQQGSARHPDVDERLLGAEAEAADRGQLHREAAGVDLGGEGLEDGLGAVARAAGAHADADAGLAGEELGEARLAHLVERGDVLDARHRPLSFLSLSTSRMRACSFTWPRIAWFTSTTGASAHWPKQATVRMVKRPSGRGEGELVGARLPARVGEAELELQPLEEGARAAGVARGAAADGDRVRALGLEVEEGVEGGDAVDARLRDAGASGHVLERLHGEVLVPVVLLQLLEDAQERAGAAALLRDDAVEEVLVLYPRQRRRQAGGHRGLRTRRCRRAGSAVKWPT